MKKIVTFLALCAVIVVASKFYLEYRYKKELDKVLAGASLVAEVVYKDLTVGLDGTIELLGLSITPNGDFNTFSFRSIKISGFDFLFHLNGISRIKKGDIPTFINLDIERFSFPASVYEASVTQNKKECQSLGSTLLYSSAGFDQVVANASAKFDLTDPLAAVIDFSSSDQISKTRISMNFDAGQVSPVALASGALPVQSMVYNIVLDEDAATAIVEHCANKFKVAPEEFLEKVVKSEKFMTESFAVNLGDSAQMVLAEFFKGGKEVTIRATPSERLKSLTFASELLPSQVVRMLNLELSLDGEDVSITTFKSKYDNDGDGFVANEDGSNSEGNGDAGSGGYQRRDLDELLSTPDGTIQERIKPKLSKKRKNNYEYASLSRLDDYIDMEVRVSRTEDRSPIEGRLLDSTENTLSVEIYRYGGIMTYTIYREDVDGIEVKKR